MLNCGRKDINLDPELTKVTNSDVDMVLFGIYLIVIGWNRIRRLGV